VAKFDRIQHLGSPTLVGLNTDTATLQANVISTQVYRADPRRHTSTTGALFMSIQAGGRGEEVSSDHL
jgi:hypothetical protein